MRGGTRRDADLELAERPEPAEVGHTCRRCCAHVGRHGERERRLVYRTGPNRSCCTAALSARRVGRGTLAGSTRPHTQSRSQRFQSFRDCQAELDPACRRDAHWPRCCPPSWAQPSQPFSREVVRTRIMTVVHPSKSAGSGARQKPHLGLSTLLMIGVAFESPPWRAGAGC